MSSRILVAYASRAGSTGGVAESIGETLAVSGTKVEVRRMREVHDLTPYCAVVAGSAIHGGKWLPEAMRFLQAQQATLARKPFAVFLVCATMSSPTESFRQGVGTWMDPVRALVRPLSEGLFAGALDASKLPLIPDGLAVRVMIVGALPFARSTSTS